MAPQGHSGIQAGGGSPIFNGLTSEVILVITIPSSRKGGKCMKEKAGNVSSVSLVSGHISPLTIQ